MTMTIASTTRKVLACVSIYMLPQASLAKVCPAATWERISPEAAGWSSAKLMKADDLARAMDTDSYLVAVGGKLMWEFGDAAQVTNVHSVRKSIASILFGIAHDRGQMPLDRTLVDLGIDDHQRLSATEKSATIRHLLSARSCI